MAYILLKTEEEFRSVIEKHNEESDYVVIDLETTGLDSFKDQIVDIQLSGFRDDEVYIAPGSMASVLTLLDATPVGHNLRFDITMLYRKGIDVSHWKYHDTMLMGHLVNETRDSYSLESYVTELWGSDYKSFWDKYDSYLEASEIERYEYGMADIIYTDKLYRFLLDSLKQESIPEMLFEHVHRLQYALLQTELQGIKIDLDYLAVKGIELKSQIEVLLPNMKSMVPNEVDFIELDLWEKELDKRKTDKGKAAVPRPVFSFDSTKQLQFLLYNLLHLPAQHNEKTKSISADDASLEKLKGTHPIIEPLQKYRGLQKVYSSYIEGTLERVKDGRIYPEFRVNGTVTGRISHSNPNLGQLPSEGGIRGIYRPSDDHVLFSADYAQLEVCLEANFTNDKNLIKIFTEGLSKHDITAEALGIARPLAKTLNFAMQYWCTPYKIAQLLHIPFKEANDVHIRYWNLYSGPKALKKKTDELINAGKPITTLFGRKRRFAVGKRPEWSGDYRQGYNFLIQGTGADLTSRAFYLISEWLQQEKLGRGLFTVHDELIVECNQKYFKEVENAMLNIMTNVGNEIGLKIPLKAESSGPCDRWQD